MQRRTTVLTSILRWSACCASGRRADGARCCGWAASGSSYWNSPAAAGRPYPLGSTSTDLWFQHMAIVVNDMRHAYQQVMANRRFRPISRHGPVRLPDDSGGVTAFKFRDHDGHPLELLAFPPGHVPGPWRVANGTGSFLGVDHTAIAVSDPARQREILQARYSGSAPELAPRTAGPNKPISTTSTTSTSASPGSRRTCPRHEWNCCTTTWARAGRSRPTPPATTSWRRTAWCGSPRLTQPPRRSPAAARPCPATTS